MKKLLYKAAHYDPEYITRFILNVYDELDPEGKEVFLANLRHYYFADDTYPQEGKES